MLNHSASLAIQHAFSKPCRAIQHVFSKPCLVNLISKDTHLVFSISGMLELTNIYLEQAAVFNCVRTPVNVTAREVRSTLDVLNLSSNFAEDFLINTNVNIQN